MAIGRPKAIDGAPRQGARQQRRNFLVPRGMTALSGSPCDLSHGVGVRQGKKVMTTLLRHRRSRRQPPFGQISPLERPLRCARSGCNHMENLVTRRNCGIRPCSSAHGFLITTGKLAASSQYGGGSPLATTLCRVAKIGVRWLWASRVADVRSLLCRRPVAAPSPSSTMTKMASRLPWSFHSHRRPA
jgi:hypothetical protein